MNKHIFFFGILQLFYLVSSMCVGQVKGGQQAKLFDLFALEKYEDCAFKAENMAMNDKYRKDPEPLLYLSMCMYKISKMETSDLDQQYKDPLKESLKYAKKFRSKDKDGRLYYENHQFFEELKIATIDKANFFYNQNQHSKAAAFLGMINGFDDSDDNIRFMKGICEILAKNPVEGAKNINDAMAGILKSRSDSAFKPDIARDSFLLESMIIYSDYLSKNAMGDSAKKTIVMAKNFFPGSREVENQYNILHGIPVEEKLVEDSSKMTEKRYEFHQPKENENIQIPPSENETPSDSLKKESPPDSLNPVIIEPDLGIKEGIQKTETAPEKGKDPSSGEKKEKDDEEK